MKPEDFKTEYKKIVYRKGQITTHKLYLRKLHAFDKNDSHKQAIIKALDKFDILKAEFNEMLKGKTYEDWKETSQKLTTLKTTLEKIEKKQIEIKTHINNLLNF